MRAAMKLGLSKNARTVEPLLKALRDEHQDVRDLVAEALAQIGDKRALEPLIAALKDQHVGPTPRLARALGEFGDSQVIEPLVTTLVDKNWKVREAASEALNKVDSNWMKTEQAKATVPALVAALKDNDNEIRVAAAETLGKIGDAGAAQSLVAMLDYSEFSYTSYSDWSVRGAAANALISMRWEPPDDTQQALVTKINNTAVIAPLIKELKSTTDSWREFSGPEWGAKDKWITIAKELGRIKDGRAAEPLAESFFDRWWSEKDTEETFVQVMANLGESGVEALRHYLYTRRSEPNAALCMAKINTKSARNYLLEAIERGSNLTYALVYACKAARAVGELAELAAAMRHEETIRAVVDAIRDMLKEFPREIKSEDLQAVTRLEKVSVIASRELGYSPWREQVKYEVDCSDLKELASHELIRRGLKA